jgi:hypothetical protein
VGFTSGESGNPPRLWLTQVGPHEFRLRERLRYHDARTNMVVSLPRDLDRFRTDLRRMPSALAALTGAGVETRDLAANVLHQALISRNPDELDYVGPPVDRDTADRVYRDALGELGVPVVRRYLRWAFAQLGTIGLSGWWGLLRVYAAVVGIVLATVAAVRIWSWIAIAVYVGAAALTAVLFGHRWRAWLLIALVLPLVIPSIALFSIAALLVWLLESVVLAVRRVGGVAGRSDGGPSVDLDGVLPSVERSVAPEPALVGESSSAGQRTSPLVFVSYRQSDRERVRPYVDRLESDLDEEVWWDVEIQPGKNWRKMIEDALLAARAVVVFWTEASIESEWVMQEAGDGERRGILVPAMLDAVDPPLGLRHIQGARLLEAGQPDEWRRLVEAVRGLIEEPALEPGAQPLPRP